MRVLLDNNLPPRIAIALNALVSPAHEVVALRSRFRPDVTDVEWIGRLGEEGGWAIISGDLRITRNRAERDAWRASRLVGFFLSPGLHRLPLMKKAARLIILWDTIESQYRLVQAGAIFELPERSPKLRQLAI